MIRPSKRAGRASLNSRSSQDGPRSAPAEPQQACHAFTTQDKRHDGARGGWHRRPARAAGLLAGWRASLPGAQGQLCLSSRRRPTRGTGHQPEQQTSCAPGRLARRLSSLDDGCQVLTTPFTRRQGTLCPAAAGQSWPCVSRPVTRHHAPTHAHTHTYTQNHQPACLQPSDKDPGGASGFRCAQGQ